jgi:uncharacterized protein YlxW (UPF0749 family)
MTIRETIQILEEGKRQLQEENRQLKEEILKLKLEIKKLKTIKVLDKPVVENQLTAVVANVDGEASGISIDDVVEESKPKRNRKRKNVESIEE